MLQLERRSAYQEEHEHFRDTARKFIGKHIAPHQDRWEKRGIVDRSLWLAAGEAGLLCPGVSPEYGGLGLDFRYNAVVDEELAYQGASTGIPLQSDIVAGYIQNYGSEEQKRQWLPKMVTGEAITAIAMTEPDAGSDLQSIKTNARRDGNPYVLNCR